MGISYRPVIMGRYEPADISESELSEEQLEVSVSSWKPHALGKNNQQ